LVGKKGGNYFNKHVIKALMAMSFSTKLVRESILHGIKSKGGDEENNVENKRARESDSESTD